jgi:hypothetical protein
MICKRCGSGSNYRASEMCFHCEVGTELDKITSGKLSDGTIQEGFPDWHKETKFEKNSKPRLF